MSEIFVHNGIVDKVRAVRRQDEVQYLEATVHLKFDEDQYQGQYGGQVTYDLALPLPIGTEVNPGDVVQVHMNFINPFGKRVMPALEVGDENPADELDEDMLAEAAVERDDIFDEDDINEAVIDVTQDA